VFRDLVLGLAEIARQDPVSIVIGKVLDRAGYLQALREEGTEEAQGRIENLAELVSAAKEFEAREPDASLTGFVDRLSLLSDADESEGAADARVLMMTLHSAKGLEFPVVFIAGLEEGLFPHSRSSDDQADLEEERRLCYVGMTRARRRLCLSSALRRRWYGEYRACQPSRFVGEVPEALVERIEPAAPSIHQPSLWGGGSRGPRYGARARRGAYQDEAPPRRGGGWVGESQPAYAYEDEDQSRTGRIEAGTRVRHPQFGAGTVISVEATADDLKLVVRFASVGTKRLLARYAKLETL
jgi:DNA helicase-2/ATP-dependent DNA helicase PcrA